MQRFHSHLRVCQQADPSPRAVGAPDFRPRSRRFSEMGAASPQGVGRRRRAIPTLEKGGVSRLGAAAPFVSIGRGAALSEA